MWKEILAGGAIIGGGLLGASAADKQAEAQLKALQMQIN